MAQPGSSLVDAGRAAAAVAEEEEASRNRAAAAETLASGLLMMAVPTPVPSSSSIRSVDFGSLPRSAGSLSGFLGNLPKARAGGWTTPEEQQRPSAAVVRRESATTGCNVASSPLSQRADPSFRVKPKLERKNSSYRGVSWCAENLSPVTLRAPMPLPIAGIMTRGGISAGTASEENGRRVP
jgi:hypothetical protein